MDAHARLVNYPAMGQSKPVKPRYQRTMLKEWRLARGLNQEQLAEMAGMTAASISRLENGHQPYSQSVLELLAAALRCEPVDIIARPPNSQRAEGERLLDRIDEDDLSRIIAMLRAWVDDERVA